MHPKRHPIRLDYTVGCDAEGRLTAVVARMLGDSGAYASVGGKVLERAAGHACGPYRVPSVDVEALAVYTNNPPCGAMRGFGAPRRPSRSRAASTCWRRRSGLDGWEIRCRNVVAVGDAVHHRPGAREVGRHPQDARRGEGRLLRGAPRRARPSGSPAGSRTPASATASPSGASAGSSSRPTAPSRSTTATPRWARGCSTVLVQFAVEVTGLPASVFRPKVDSTFALGCGQTTGSRATLFGGRAVTSAAPKLRADLDAGLQPAPTSPAAIYAADEVVDDTTALGARRAEDQDPHVLRLRDAGRDPGRGRARRARGRRARRGPRR